MTVLEIPYPYIDPVAIDFPGPIDIRWYGLAYLATFVAGYFVLRWLSDDGFLRMPPERVGDFLFALMIGTILGGRLGYILFYDFSSFVADPARIIRLWEGGLAFHGGLIGVLLAAGWVARREHVPFLNLGDSLALVVPFGLFAGRVANFINGELFGRAADPDLPWAMRFPTDPQALRVLGAADLPIRQRELVIEQALETGVWDTLRLHVPPRHPSQLYEALLEGVVLALIVWAIYAWARRHGSYPRPGLLSGVFLIGYGGFRSFVELFRQPDPQFRGPDDPLGTVLGPLTMGQTLSAVMVAVGVVVVVRKKF